MDEGDTVYLELGTVVEVDAEKVEQEDECMMEEQNMLEVWSSLDSELIICQGTRRQNNHMDGCGELGVT